MLKIARHTGWCMKYHTTDCAHNTFLLLQKHLTSGTELILIGWKFVSNEEHVQCDHCFASQPLANESLHSSQLFDTSLQKARGTTSLCSAAQGPHSEAFRKRVAQLHYVVQLRVHIVKLRARFLKTCVKKMWQMQGFVCKRLWGKTVVTLNMFFIRNNFPAYED